MIFTRFIKSLKSRVNKQNFDFFEISRKSVIFRQKSRFLTYVNFSLSAKFNRFFIILGGVRSAGPKIAVFLKFEENRGFSRFLAYFAIMGGLRENRGFSRGLFKPRNSRKIVDFLDFSTAGVDRVEEVGSLKF